MSNYTIRKFIDEQIRDISEELRDIQIEIQFYSQLHTFLSSTYYTTWTYFTILFYALLNDKSGDIDLEFYAFLEAKYNYELCEFYSIYLEQIIYLLNNMKNLEKLTREDYAELVQIKEDGYNLNEFTTFMYRNAKRFETLFDIVYTDV